MRKPKTNKKKTKSKNNKDSFCYDPNLPIDQVLKNLFQKNSENFTHDFVSYRIFIVQPELTSRFKDETKTIEDFNEELFFEKSCEIHNFLKERIPENYVWQGDMFNITFVSPPEQLEDCTEEMFLRNNQPVYPYICGRVNFSETNIDEWFITYLLVELSKNFKDQVVVQISDQDGEFLLIEAADYIAEWMNDEPELTTNRVFIYNGKLHILPDQPETPSYSYYEVFPISKPIQNIHKAVEMVFRESKYCQSEDSIQNCISTRLSSFPKEAVEFGSQKIACYLPLDVIRLLDKHPQIVSKCIYYLTRKNTVTEKFLKSFSRFLPTEPSSDNGSLRDYFTYYSVNVNRCQYVQLISSRIDVNDVPKLASIYRPSNKRTDKQEKAYELGFKILCGLEMYYHAEKPIDIFDSFEDYVDHLYDHGYFGLEMSGTDKFNNLVTKSKTYYDEFGKTANCYFIEQALMEGSTLSMKEIKQRKLIVDTDDWLDSANEEMEKYFSQKGFSESGEGEQDIEKKAKDMMDKVKSFIEEEESNIGGVKTKSKHKTSKDDWSFISSSSTAPNDQSRLDNFLKETFGKYPIEELIEKFNIEEEVDEDEDIDDNENDDDDWEDEETIDPEMEDLMQKMDDELYQFGDTQQRSEITDANVMKNLLRSLQAQGSEYGPTSVLLQHLGLDVPYFDDEIDEE
ncbi:predicted protein [Naegleria gruberi]|uniref:Predicted protein n=1 Tax=Naegleria gruberi TaxID=5762 RepID=D2VTD7_NAEGR|nr:uncharacterized protein NAEGRDRAFT_52097 [Naegleria gruberi]EFC39913.1 predicted protein [Naegleria gruberi]|eukprot:XP_002672657.1 predicted protein [Naegleria gruberi strain NEG-M]